MTEQTEPVVVEVAVGAPIETVWRSLRDPALIRLWHGWNYDQLDAEIDVIFVKGAEADDERQVLHLGDGDRFELHPDTRGTLVRIVRAPYVAGSEFSDFYAEITEGWLSFLQQLRFMHEQHPEEARRTLFFSGTGTAESLPGLLAVPPEAVGEILYAAEHQGGQVLPDLGPGLLITASKAPVTDDQGRVAVDAMAILSTYGLDDDQFSVQAEKWATWWRSAYPDADDPQT
ncbi:MAG: hypothetical protein ABWX96_07925 [Propionibacteriaceae bacterium]